MKWFKDGDQLVLVKNDFIDLQESNALFFNWDSEEAKNIRKIMKSMDGISKKIGQFIREYNTSSDRKVNPELVKGVLMVCNSIGRIECTKLFEELKS